MRGWRGSDCRGRAALCSRRDAQRGAVRQSRCIRADNGNADDHDEAGDDDADDHAAGNDDADDQDEAGAKDSHDKAGLRSGADSASWGGGHVGTTRRDLFGGLGWFTPVYRTGTRDIRRSR